MNNFQIEKALRSEPFTKDVFVGVFSADNIAEKEFPGAYIVNTDPINKPGEHWVAFYCTENRTLEAFDSFGGNPASYSEYIKEWMGSGYIILSNTVLQSTNSTLCGNYCLYFLLLRCSGFSYEDVLSVFCKNEDFNDKFVFKFVNKYFNLRTKMKDSSFIFKSLLKNG